MLRYLLVFACLLFTVTFTLHALHLPEEDWASWKQTHSKLYSENEEGKRRMIWEENVNLIEKHNLEHSSGLHTFTLGMNQFGDMTFEEFSRQRRGLSHPKQQQKAHNGDMNLIKDVPNSVDWRTKGYVTPVRNEMMCGACWAISGIEALEGQIFRKTGVLPVLSPQNVLDCSKKEGGYGCNGGFMEVVYKYCEDNGGIDSETCYPYQGENLQCRFNSSSSCVKAHCKGYVDVRPPKDEEVLKQVVRTVGPVAVAIDAQSQSFQFYKQGVYDNPNCSSTILDHSVTIVGYGPEDPSQTEYWIAKNVWGTAWGMDGYVFMSRNKNNQCGIANNASYPLV